VRASGAPDGSPAAELGVGGERVRQMETGAAAAGLWRSARLAALRIAAAASS
jgi:hypothetical protein